MSINFRIFTLNVEALPVLPCFFRGGAGVFVWQEWGRGFSMQVVMKPRDIVLLATFVNSILLGLLLILSKPEEGTVFPTQRQEIKPIMLPVVVEEESEVVEAEPLLIAPEVPAAPVEEWYVMKSGDNPWKVAKTNKIKFDDLLKLNGLNEERARNLKPGDRIRIR